MASLADAKSRDEEILVAQIGSTLHNGRYKIVAPHISTIQTPYHYDYTMYIAQDTKESRYVCLRILGTTASKVVAHDRIAIAKVTDAAAARQHLLLPLDTFDHDGHACVTTELVGPELHRLRAFDGPEYANFPPRWLHQVAHDALQALQFLHARGWTYGAVEPMDLVLAYPHVDAASAEQVQRAYRPFPAAGKPGLVSFSETGTAMLNQPDDGRFQLKLQNFARAFRNKGTPAQLSAVEYKLWPTPPPPELELQDKVGPFTDMWYLGMTLADLFSATPESATVVGDRDGTPLENLLETQAQLGPLPSSFAALLPAGVEGPKPAEVGSGDLREVMQEQRAQAEKGAVTGKDKVEPFAERDLELAVDLVAGLLRYEPEERLTAEKALEHDFFKIDGLIE